MFKIKKVTYFIKELNFFVSLSAFCFTILSFCLQSEDGLILYLELAVNIAQENKDRLSQIWPSVKRHLQWLLTSFGKNPHVVERAVVGLLRIANRNLFRLKDDIAEEVLQSLSMLLVSYFIHFLFFF